METRLDYLPTSPFPRDPLSLGRIYAGGAGPQLNNLDLEDDYHPFKVYVMSLKAQGSQARGKWGVEYKSVVFKDKNDFTNQTVTGLLTNRLNFNDSGWNEFPTQQDMIVYLKGTVSGGLVTAIDVDSDLTLAQLNTKKRITGSGISQTEFICPIARLFRYGSNPQRLGVEQYVKTNLMLRKVSFGDEEGWYPCPGPAGGAAPPPHPWKVYLKKINGNWKVGVEPDSFVYKGVTWSDCPVTGRLTKPVTDGDSQWKSPQTGYLFLWGRVDENGNVTSIEIKNDQTNLANMPRVKAVSGKQTEFVWVIGYLWSQGTGDNIEWYVRQDCNRHVTLMNVVVNGLLCLVPFEM